MKHLRNTTFAVAIVLSLVGCSTNGNNTEADCGYYQDSANVMLANFNDAMNSPYDSGKFYRIDKAASDWAARVLEAPEGCFPQSDIDQANEWIQYKP